MTVSTSCEQRAGSRRAPPLGRAGAGIGLCGLAVLLTLAPASAAEPITVDAEALGAAPLEPAEEQRSLRPVPSRPARSGLTPEALLLLGLPDAMPAAVAPAAPAAATPAETRAAGVRILPRPNKPATKSVAAVTPRPAAAARATPSVAPPPVAPPPVAPPRQAAVMPPAATPAPPAAPPAAAPPKPAAAPRPAAAPLPAVAIAPMPEAPAPAAAAPMPVAPASKPVRLKLIEPAAGPSAGQVALAPSTLPAGAVRLAFARNATTLDDKARAALAGLARSMKEDDTLRLQLVAHAQVERDGAGQARRLSLTRALAVRSFLMEQGVRSTRMDVRPLGPATDDGPPDRVDALVVKP